MPEKREAILKKIRVGKGINGGLEVSYTLPDGYGISICYAAGMKGRTLRAEAKQALVEKVIELEKIRGL